MITKVGIIGATGLVGAELLRLLLNHPFIEVSGLSSKTFKEHEITRIYPNFKGYINKVLKNDYDVIDKSDVIFTALPHGLSENIASEIIEKNKILIDIGADFRLSNEDDYFKFYKKNYQEKELHKASIYSIPELHRDKIKKTNIIANPGCYPTSIALALVPALKLGIVKQNSIVIDSKSGLTGAGRVINDNNGFINCNENFKAYTIGGRHRHIPEIEELINQFSLEKQYVSFTPHLLPINRGILSTIYFDLEKNINKEDFLNEYKNFYKDEKFIRVLDNDELAEIKNIRYSNYCDLSINIDERCNRCIIVSVIDNMIKGAAGQAIQNMNIRLGIDEDVGLINHIPSSF